MLLEERKRSSEHRKKLGYNAEIGDKICEEPFEVETTIVPTYQRLLSTQVEAKRGVASLLCSHNV